MSRREIGPHDRPLWGGPDPDLDDERAAWIAAGLDRIEAVPIGTVVTHDDLRAELAPPASRYWPGILWLVAHRRQLVEPVGHHRSTARSRRHGVSTTWVRVAA